MKTFWIYILSSGRNGTLYIGVTNNLARRMYEHINSPTGFVKKYGVNCLVYAEPFDDINTALRREKSVKRWNRDWKLQLIEKHNPNWDDLYPGLMA